MEIIFDREMTKEEFNIMKITQHVSHVLHAGVLYNGGNVPWGIVQWVYYITGVQWV